jgi:hypothetical protein
VNPRRSTPGLALHHRRPAHFRRGFTLLEVVLAAVLGVLVVTSSLALFSMMDRAKRLQNDRLETNTELALAHKVLQQAFSTLLMEASPEPKDDELKDRIKKDLEEADDTHAQDRREDAATMRFAVQPDISKRSMTGQVMQSIDLTLTTPPIHGVTRSLDAQQQEDALLHQIALNRNRSTSVWGDRSSSSTSSSASSSATKSGLGSSKSSSLSGSDKSSSSNRERNPDATTSRADRLRAAAAGLGGSDASADRLNSLASEDVEPPRAPGVRGVFEFRQEDDPKVLLRLAGNPAAQGGAWALWWKQIPPDDDLDVPPPPADASGSGANAARDRAERLRLIDLARASRTDTPEVKLLSGISSAQWQVYRRRKMVSKMAAAYAKELPAYVNFKFDTVDGRHQDWLFEVAWSYGQEPGTVLAVNDPLGAPGDPNNPAGGGGDVAAAVQAAIDAANGGGPKPTGNTPGSVATGPSGSGPSGSGPKPGGNPNVSGGNGRPIVITLPGGGTITIPANAQPGGGR